MGLVILIVYLAEQYPIQFSVMVDFISECSLQQDCKLQTAARAVEVSVSVPFSAVQRLSHTDGHVWTLTIPQKN